MKDEDSKRNELKGLEKEIDRAIDSLFVEKGSQKEQTQPAGVSATPDDLLPDTERQAEPHEPEAGVRPVEGQKGIEEDIDQAIDSLFVERAGGEETAPVPATGEASAQPTDTSELDLQSLTQEMEDENSSIDETPIPTAAKGSPDGQEGIEEDIGRAIDTLFVEKGHEKEEASRTTVSVAPEDSGEPPVVDLESIGEEVVKESRSLEQERLPGETEGSLENYEGKEKEVEQAIGSFRGEEGSEEETAPATTIGGVSIEAAKAVAPESHARTAETKVSVKQQNPSGGENDQTGRNLENLESHLLSLEWEINPELIQRVISELAFLKKAYRNDRASFQVVELMDKVTHSLANDEGNITPNNLRFLLEAKDGIKLLGNELKNKEDFKNVVLSGILARYRLMREEGAKEADGQHESAREGDFQNLTQSLRDLSQRLQHEIRQLGSITQRLQGGTDHSAPSRMIAAFLVETSGRVFAMENDIVVRSVQIPYRMARTVWRDREIRIRGVRLPLVNLFRLFKSKAKVKAENKVVVLVKKGDRTLALLVDRCLQKKAIPVSRIREESRQAHIRGVVPTAAGQSIYFLDIDRIMVEF
jgi:hypothetical protein